MDAYAGSRGFGRLHVRTAKDRKGGCRAAVTRTAEPDKNKRPSSASGQGQKHPSTPFVREAPEVCPLPGCFENVRRPKEVKLDASGGVRKGRKHPC